MVRLKQYNLLFLEDNEDFALYMTELLESYFQHIFHAKTIQEAVVVFKNEITDVILSDIKLQRENGLHFIKKVREENASIPIVILSGYKDEAFLFEAIPLYILAYELKPLSTTQFKTMLQKIANSIGQTVIIQLTKDLYYNTSKKELLEDELNIPLTQNEILLVELLLKHRNRIVTSQMIQEELYAENFVSDSALKNLLFRLRKKVKSEFIITITKLGYRLI